MAEVMIQNASWRWIWNHYIFEGKKNGLRNEQIRKQLIEAFRKEIFDQMMFRMKVDDLSKAMPTHKNEAAVISITKNTKTKWMRLVRECRKHPETAGLLMESDLTLEDPKDEDDGHSVAEAEEENRFEFQEVGDPDEEYASPWDGNEKTAENQVPGVGPLPIAAGQDYPAGYWAV